jgi:hypothetical protein
VTRYAAFGLTVASNRALAGLAPAAPGAAPDVVVEFAAGREPETDEAAREAPEGRGWRAIRPAADGGRVFMAAAQGGLAAWSVHASGDGTRVEVRWRGDVAPEDVGVLVVTSVLPAILVLQGVPLLHGCAIATDGGAIVVLGGSGAGKSTVAAAAVASGRALLSDDVCALAARDDGVHVQPGPAQLRMYEDTAAAFGWDARRLFVAGALDDKRCVDLSAADGTFCPEPRRVAAVAVLAGGREREARIERVPAARALPLLLRNTYADHMAEAEGRARLLPFWTRLAEAVPVLDVTPAEGVATVPGLVEAISGSPSDPAAGRRPSPRPCSASSPAASRRRR